MLDAMRDDLNSGRLRVYSGTRPTDADTALAGNTLLVELTFNATAFGAAASGVITANAITGGTAAATGTASFIRCLKSDGSTAVCDLSCTASGGGGEMQLSTLSIVSGVAVTASSLTISLPVGT